MFGTMDSWLIWRMTGRHLTDVTNASRTMLMNLHTLEWDERFSTRSEFRERCCPRSGRHPKSMARR